MLTAHAPPPCHVTAVTSVGEAQTAAYHGALALDSHNYQAKINFVFCNRLNFLLSGLTPEGVPIRPFPPPTARFRLRFMAADSSYFARSN